MIKPELLAPAGSMDSLRAAVNNGADAVYLGAGSFNARVNAENFTPDEIAEAVIYAHLYGVRVYFTLNTLIRDEEMSEAIDLAYTAWSSGVDAIIVQDIGLLRNLREKYPKIVLHASTQMNLFDTHAIEWAAANGISRVVLPRELSVDEIETRTNAAKELGIETEVFVHGALCVCYSGLCLFSAMNGNGMRSGNRGLCAQPCRTMFRMKKDAGTEESEGRLLSPKDRCALDYLERLIKAGVRSLKIEGRMKEPAYVAAVVKAYREYIDGIFGKEDLAALQDRERKHLLLAFNRGGSFTDQYLNKKKSDHFLSGNYSGRFGVLSGIIVKKNARAGTLSIRLAGDVVPSRGDYLSIRVKDKEIASFPVGTAEKVGEIMVVQGLHPQMIEQIPDGAEAYQMSETAYTRDLLNGKPAYKTGVAIRLSLTGRTVSLEMTVTGGIWKGTTASAADTISPDTDYPVLSAKRIEEQLRKLKSSPFEAVRVDMEENLQLFVPVSFLNELRRNAVSALENEIITALHPKSEPADMTAGESAEAVRKTAVETSGTAAAEPISRSEIAVQNILLADFYDLNRILPEKLASGADYYSFSIYDLQTDEAKTAVEELHREEPEARFLIRLPGAYKDQALPVFARAVGFMKRVFPDHFAGVVSSSPARSGENVWISSSANIYNRDTLRYVLAERPTAVSLSYELKDPAILDLISGFSAKDFRYTYLSLHRYGRIEWMQSEFCPVGQNAENCAKCRGKSLAYRMQIKSGEEPDAYKGRDLPVVTHPGLCTSEILGPLMPSVGEDVLSVIRTIGIPGAHTVRFLDETQLERLKITRQIRSDWKE